MPVGACDSAFQARLADEIQWMPPGTSIDRPMIDYSRQRDQGLACVVPKNHILKFGPFWSQVGQTGCSGRGMPTLSSGDATYNLGQLIDTERADPVTVESPGRVLSLFNR